MSCATILIIAMALGMDAFAASIATGIAIKTPTRKHALIVALWFGSFQAVMPLIGWLCCMKIVDLICGIDHWLAFGLLSAVGCKMLYESFKIEAIEKVAHPLSPRVLCLLAIATSIDALAAGISFAVLNEHILIPMIAIGVTTFVLSFIGVGVGAKTGHILEKKVEIAAGFLLIGIGIKILVDHTM
jgi:putative Mn2+ efflux pump MntP